MGFESQFTLRTMYDGRADLRDLLPQERKFLDFSGLWEGLGRRALRKPRKFPLEAFGPRTGGIERFEKLGIFGAHPLDLDQPVLFGGFHFRGKILAL